jgi:DNA-binding HxlR family transcriptional regulator
METVTTTASLVVRRGSITDCPLTAAVNAIDGKWNLICLYWLDSGTRRFNHLRPLIEVVLVWGHGHIQWLTGAQERV